MIRPLAMLYLSLLLILNIASISAAKRALNIKYTNKFDFLPFARVAQRYDLQSAPQKTDFDQGRCTGSWRIFNILYEGAANNITVVYCDSPRMQLKEDKLVEEIGLLPLPLRDRQIQFMGTEPESKNSMSGLAVPGGSRDSLEFQIRTDSNFFDILLVCRDGAPRYILIIAMLTKIDSLAPA